MNRLIIFLRALSISGIIVFVMSGCIYFADKSPGLSEHKPDLSEERWKWFNIVIGVSTMDDLLSELGFPDSQHNLYSQNQVIGEVLGYIRVADETHLPDSKYISFFVVDGVVEALEVSSVGIPYGTDHGNLLNLVEEWGKPDLISFSKCSPNERIAVWVVEGVQAEISLLLGVPDKGHLFSLENTQIVGITYFSPLSKNSYFQSFLSVCYSDTPAEGDVLDLNPADPFSWRD